MSTFLITSAAYCSSEFTAEFGLLPPAFLPIGNKRLFEHQVGSIHMASTKRLLLSIPDNYLIDEFDRKQLDALHVEVYLVPVDLSLADSIVYTLNAARIEDGELRILHGDTLIEGIPLKEGDAVSIGCTEEYYTWASWQDGEDIILDGLNISGYRKVITGYFAFSSSHLFSQALGQAQGSFISGLNIYNKLRPLRRLECGPWLDFGHIQTYYSSRRHMTTQRAFNTLHMLPRIVQKSSAQKSKIFAEARWFSTAPSELKPFLPQLITGYSGDLNQIEASYVTEYLPLLPLNELFVYGRLPQVVWSSIFRACSEFSNICGNIQPSNCEHELASANDLYLVKTLERLDKFTKSSGISLDADWTLNGRTFPSLKNIAIKTAASLNAASTNEITIIHGDFCLSNILYDFRNQAIKVIDPRGANAAGVATIYGDRRYDSAKLYHSVMGYYDLIMAGRFEFKREGENSLYLSFPKSEHILNAQLAFMESKYNISPNSSEDSLRISVLLFLSMLPLHDDRPDRQNALMANALRLFGKLSGDVG